MRPLTVFLQDVIARDTDLVALRCGLEGLAGGASLTNFTAEEAEAGLARLPEGARPLVFSSIQIARRTVRAGAQAARGVLLPTEFLGHHVYRSLLPAEQLLSPRGIYLPWAGIPSELTLLRQAFGDELFIRPVSPLKPFTGFTVRHSDLPEEIRVQGELLRLDPSLLCFVAPAVPMPPCEHRVWIVDSQPVTAAAYAWDEAAAGAPVPEEVLEAAARIARQLELREQHFTADFAVIEGAARLVELNAISTSGWYGGMDPLRLIEALERNLV